MLCLSTSIILQSVDADTEYLEFEKLILGSCEHIIVQ